jgi:hypothetical protein
MDLRRVTVQKLNSYTLNVKDNYGAENIWTATAIGMT